MPRTSARPRLTVGLAAALCGYLFALFAPQLFNDGDTYLHLAAGRWILAHHAVPRVDPFTFSFAGQPWDAHEWLAQLLMAGAFQVGGWSGLAVLIALALALALGLLGAELSRHVIPLAAGVMLALAASCLSPMLLARPHILALPPLVIWTAGLLAARRRGTAPSPWLLALMLVWANLHGSFVLGLALLAPFALEALIAAPRAGGRRTLVGWAGFGLAAAAVSAVTPQGLHGLIFPLQLMGLRQNVNINEWQPVSFAALPPIELALMAFLYAALSRGMRLPVLRLLLLMGLLHLALAHARHGIVLAVVAPLLLADPLTGAFAVSTPPAPTAARRSALPICAALAVVLLATALRAEGPVRRHDAAASPITAIAHLPPDLRDRPVFNDYAFGGYLMFAGIRPLVDGRADLFGDAFLDAYGNATQDKAAFLAMAARYRIVWAILRPNSATAAMVESVPGWHRIYADDVAVIERGPDPPP
jgi:hypothetical protein